MKFSSVRVKGRWIWCTVVRLPTFFGRLRDRFDWRMKEHELTRQAGAIPFTILQGQVVFLLITSRRTGRWIFPKGSLIEGKKPWEVAAYEAFGEAGVEGEIETQAVGFYRSIKTVGIGRRPIEVEMFPLRIAQQFEEWPEMGSRHRHWATLPEAKRLLAEPGVAELAVRLNRRVLSEAQPAT
jgi:predicted NUDIX family NTP pyrophosphohydrolase